jgi:outer membrane protein OmpA-like peptidoglycan-associated protein
MTVLRGALCAAVAATMFSGALAGSASAQDQRYDPYPGNDQGARHDAGRDDRRLDFGPDRDDEGRGARGRNFDLAGPGVGLLLPELRDTRRGRKLVMRRFDFNRDGLVQPEEARAANRAFRDGLLFGPDRDERGPPPPRDIAPPPPPPPPARPAPAFDQRSMREYHFRQSDRGAVFTLPDVLFETGSARLRRTADPKLRPLAAYLRGRPAQRLHIDGYTDSVGTAQANLILSRDRAQSVADALSAMGVDGSRFELEGHGEDSPVASNANPTGRQLNRRVEVTLLGQRAEVFQ